MARKVLVVALLASFAIAAGSVAMAAQYSRGSNLVARRGPIATLIEMERRKNEWLRRTFLGR